MSETEERTLRDDLVAAFADAGDSTPAPDVATPPIAAHTPAPTPEAAAGAVRDEQGRFAPKAAAAAPETPKTTDQPATAAPEAPELIQPPASWSAQAKAKFATLDPEVQQEIRRREADVSKGFEERASQLKKYEPLEAVIAPHRERIALAGVDEAGYVRSLIAADEMLRGPNRFQAIAQIAQSYGIDLRQYTQPGQPGQQPQAQQPPELQAALQRLQQLESTIAQQQTASQQAEQAQLQTTIETFAKDHLYFDNVRAEMAALMRAGQAETLDKAYEMACWARADIRPLMLAEQEKGRTAQTAEAARAKAADAKRAAGSITGSSAPGSVPAASGPPPSIREALQQAFQGGV